VLIIAYDSNPKSPTETVIAEFEARARELVAISDRHEAAFSGLVHPMHKHGSVCAWEVSA
jgi:hypothetical protein